MLPTKITKIALPLVVFLSLLTSCTKKKDTALETALDELKRLSSVTDTGLTYPQYCDRLLTAKANIEVALQHTEDRPARDKILEAVNHFVTARNFWKLDIDANRTSGNAVQECWTKGHSAADAAAEYAFAGAITRWQIDTQEKDRKQHLAEADLSARLTSGKIPTKEIGKYSAAEGNVDGPPMWPIVLTDVSIEIQRPATPNTLWFGDITEGIPFLGNLLVITTKTGSSQTLRFANLEDRVDFGMRLQAALNRWRRRFGNAAQ